MDNGNRIVRWLGNGDGSFGAPAFTDIPTGGPSDFAVADFNGDGHADLAYVTSNGSPMALSILPGDGAGGFGPRAAVGMGYGYNTEFIQAADLNGDGFPDLILGGNDHVTVATNRGNGGLGFDLARRSHGQTYGVAVGDLDGDGVAELVVTAFSGNHLRVLDGAALAPLAADDTLHGVLHGYGRGHLTDNSDRDHFSFTAKRGQVLSVAVDYSMFAGSSSLRWRIYDETGSELSTFVAQQGENSPLVIPRDGIYVVRVEVWNAYYGEYRFRVSLLPAGTQLENESNNTVAQANVVSFQLVGNELVRTLGGYLAGYDTSGDFFALGNLSAGTQVTADLRLPSTSTITAPQFALFRGTTQVTPDLADAGQLVHTVASGEDGAYSLRLTGAGRGMMAEYFIDVAVADLVPPSIVADTLPAEGSTVTMVGPSFNLTFSEDMLAPTVRDGAHYELVSTGDAGESYTVIPGNYVSGLANSYFIPDGPLQPGDYRFTVFPGLQDKVGNAMAASYVRTWTVAEVPGYVLESRSNDTVGTADSLSLNIAAGVPSGSFLDLERTFPTAASPYALELADLDGDGVPDAVVTHHGSVNGMSILAGNGDRSFDVAQEFPGLGTNPQDVLVADFDNDGKPDIAVVTGSGIVALFRNVSEPGAIAFERVANVEVGSEPYRLAAGDLTGNGLLDLVVSNRGTNNATGRSVSVLVNDGTGGFTESRLGEDLSPRVRPWAIALADFDGDGRLDLVAGDMDNGNRIVRWLGNGDGSFGAPSFTDIPSGNPSPADFAVADFNGDGTPDLAWVTTGGTPRELSVLPGDGAGGFGPRVATAFSYGSTTSFLRVADLNGDGFPDLVLGGSDHVTVATNRGNGDLRFDLVRRSHGATHGVAVGDLDGDGVAELVVTAFSGNHLRVFDGAALAPLAADDTLHGVLHGYGRGHLTDNSDRDHFSFTAKRGQVLSVAVDYSMFAGSSSLRWRIYDETGSELSTFVAQQGENSPLVIPRDGIYVVRVEVWNAYYGEYRFRVSLLPAGTQLENESNNTVAQANVVSFQLVGNELVRTLGGYLAGYDTSGDFFALGNLSAGTQVTADLRLPSTSTITAPQFALFRGTTQVTPDSADAGQLVHTVASGEDGAYSLRLTGAGRGSMAEYFIDVAVADLVPPSIVADTLPAPSSSSLITGFSLTFNKDLLASTVTSAANYSLLGAGPDGVFGTADDTVYQVAPSSYSSGLNNSYSITNGPLQPGIYRFTASTAISDKFANNLAVPYEREFVVVNPAGYQTEIEPNGTLATATVLIFNDEIPGYLTANGRGIRIANNDEEFWKFDAEAGDLLVLETHLPFESVTVDMQWRLTDPDGAVVFNRRSGSNDLETFAPSALTKTGTYHLQIYDWNSVRTEHRFRVTLLRGMAYEAEPNDTIASANPVTFTPVNGIPTASIAGFITTSGQLDYFDLGPLESGQTVFLSIRRPSGSTLGPIVSLYSAAGVIQNEINGVPGDDSAEVQISTAGNYIALVRSHINSHGLNGTYVLDARVVDTSSINFPNLRVTRLDDVTAPNLRTGDVVPISFEVTNVGTLGTGASSWVDRVVISPNPVYGDGDDIQVAVIPRIGELAPGESYTVNANIKLPDGLPGSYYLMVRTDAGNAVDENLFGSDNTTIALNPFSVSLQDYADLMIEGLAFTGPDDAGTVEISWDLANRGAGPASGGHATRVQVVNVTSGEVLSDVTLPVNDPMASGEVVPQGHQVAAVQPGIYMITVSADSANVIYEYGFNGHGVAEQNTVQTSFQIFRYFDIQVAASPVAGGSVTGGGSIREGELVTVTASADTSSLPYTFVNWTENGSFVSNQPSYSFVAAANRNLVAVFTLPQYLIAATVSPPGSGTVSGGGTRALGSTVTLTATPSTGYLFDHWLEDGLEIGNVSPLVFTASANRSITAVFAEANLIHAVTLATNPPELAVIDGAGSYENGQTLNTTAPATIIVGETEYVFQNFRLNGNVISSSNQLVKTFSTVDPAAMHYVASYLARPVKPVVQSVVTNHPTTIVPIQAETRFTVTFDRPMNQDVAPALEFASADAAAVPAVPSGSWISSQAWRSGPIVFTAQNGGAYGLQVSLATDADERVMNPAEVYTFSVDPLLPLAAPVISPSGGTFNEAVTVSMVNVATGATIYYTTDGSEPTTNAQVYGGPFSIGASATVRARAFKAGHHPSSIVSATYIVDAEPPVITGFAWNGAPLVNGAVFTARGTLSATATDNTGIASAQFFYQPAGTTTRVPIGTDTTPGNGLTMDWNIANVADGSYSVIVRVFDTTGTWTEESREVTVALAAPPAPLITQPVAESTVESPTVAIRVESTPNANIRIFRNNAFLFSSYANSSGVLNYTASLTEGATSVFKATSVNRAGTSPDSNSVSVTRVREFPQLALSFGSNTVGEGMPVTGTLTIPQAHPTDVVVQIVTNRPSRMETVAPVVIPAGSTSATFTLVARVDTIIQLLTTVQVSASAPEFRSTLQELFLADSLPPDVVITLDESTVSEGIGSVGARVTRSPASNVPLRVDLTNSLPSRVQVPAFVTIPGGSESAAFNIGVIDNDISDGNQTAVITGEVRASGVAVSVSPQALLEVLDNDGPSLAFTTPRPLLNEGEQMTLILRRSGGDLGQSLQAHLSQTPAGQLTLPASVTFAANSAEVLVPVTAITGAGGNGTRDVSVRAGAADYSDAISRFVVSDVNKPDLVPRNVFGPSRVLTEQTISIDYRVENYGPAPATVFLERVFLSKDRVPSGDDILVRQVEQTGTVAGGGGYGRTLSIFAPRDVGDYYLIVTLDPGGVVDEISKTNNTAVSVVPIEVRAAYSATVQTAVEVVPANTPIPFTGSASRTDGLPAQFSMVNIHIRSGGTERVISAITNSLGQFSTTWTPLPNEGGVFTIGATHPGTSSAPVQDGFEILTMGFDPPSAVRLNEGETVVVEAVIRNPNGRDLTGLSITTGDLPAGLTIQPIVTETTVSAEDELRIPFTISAASGFSGSGRFQLIATTNEGVTMSAGLNVRSDLLRPVLSISPDSLQASLLRGESRTVSFDITNTGGLATGSIQLLLPNLPWLTSATANQLPSIAPGETASITLQLAPGDEVPLTLYSGNLALNAANGGSRAVPYRFRVVSDLKGDLEIAVVNELFYFTADSPKLEGAVVTVRDAVSSQQVASAVTGPDGVVTFPALNEGWYRLEVVADRHDRYSNNIYLVSGETNKHLVFISKQLVTYSWTVEQVEIQDIYRIKIETTFETNVPAPVVTVSPARLDVEDLVALGQSKVVNMTLTNHGFISADNGDLDFSQHPFYEFTPLVTNVGTIPAKSSLVVPVTIRRVGVFDEDGNVLLMPKGAKSVDEAPLITRSGGGIPCGAGGKLLYTYPCGPNDVSKSVPIGVSGVRGNCSGPGGPGSPGGGSPFPGGYFNPGGPGGGPGGPGVSSNSISFAGLDACDPCVQLALLECFISYIPVLGDLYGAGKCGYSTGNYVFNGGSGKDALKDCASIPIGKIPGGNALLCIESLAGCGGGGFGGGGGGAAGSREPVVVGDENDSFDFEIGTPWLQLLSMNARQFAVETNGPVSRVETMYDFYAVIFGTRQRMLLVADPNAENWQDKFSEFIAPDSLEEARISPSEEAELATLVAGFTPNERAEFAAMVARWNRSIDYGLLEIYEIEDVPEGHSTDFIPDSRFKEAAERMIAAFDESRDRGFADPLEEVQKATRDLQEAMAGGGGGVCSRVKIELSQDLMLTRTAFEATLVLENQRDDGAVTDVGFDLRIRDALGQPAEDLFNIQISSISGLGAIDGTGEIAASSSGRVKWTLIPRDTAAQTEERIYTIGGVITYVQDGTRLDIPVENVPITVRPDASLRLKYFHQRDVLSNDPHTDVIEPAVPYKLAVMVENEGFGTARGLRIISGQPQIVENEKGLFIDFKIIATEVDGQPLTPSLTANFGDLLPGQRKIATWLMTSTLQGHFIDYDATFEHVTGLGDSRISLLESVEIHELTRTVYALNPDRDDGVPDFLVNDIPDVNSYPDTIHYSDGGTDIVTVRETGTFTGTLSPENLSITLDTGAFTGWSYIRLPDPGSNVYQLQSVVRQDGRVLPIDFNAWQSDRTFIGQGRRPTYERILHLADSDSSGIYTLNYTPVPTPDNIPPTSTMVALPAESLPEVVLQWSGSDNRGVAFYDIHVSADGGPFELWRSGVRETGAIYQGEPGASYAFFSIAVDQSGNRELKEPLAEATTSVVLSNEPPVIAPISPQTVNERSLFTYQVAATDPDGEDSLIRYSIASNVTGVVIDPVTGLIRWNTGETDGGKTASVIVAATDGGSPPAVANASFTITVNEVNHAPEIAQVGPQSLPVGGVLIVQAAATDSDFPAQTLTFSLEEAPAGAVIAPSTGVITWSPTEDQAGSSHAFTLRVTDSGTPSLSATMSFSATVSEPEVEPGDRPPVFVSVPVVLWLEGHIYQLTVAAVDPDGDPIFLSANLAGAPGSGFADLGGGTGVVSWNTTGTGSGVYQIPVSATANGATANASVRIRIEEDNLYWSWAKDAFGELGADFDFALLDMDADPDRDGRGNVHEMALLTDPLVADQVPVEFEFERSDPFGIAKLKVHLRAGSQAFVDLGIQSSANPAAGWALVPPANWSASVNPFGNEDGRAETEAVYFNIFEFHPDGLPEKSFYRIETKRK